MAPKTGPDYFPGQRSHLENSKTRVRTGTSLEELPGNWLPGAYLGGGKRQQNRELWAGPQDACTPALALALTRWP